MQSDRATLSKTLAIVLLATGSYGHLSAVEREQHLLPTQPNFDTLAPYGDQFGKISERMLFPASGWIIRYFQIIGDPPYDTGLTIYRKTGGSCWLQVRQAKPEIKDIIRNAYYKRVNLRSSLALVKIESSDRQVPSEVALEMHELWLSLLRKTSANKQRDHTYYIHPATVILMANDRDGVTLSGKYPPDAPNHRIFMSLEAIVDNLVRSCDAEAGDRVGLLRKVAKDARRLRASIEVKRKRNGRSEKGGA